GPGAGIRVGLIGSLLLVVVGPNVMGPKGLIFKGSDPLFPLENPGIVSIPLGFLAAWLGTVLSREPASEEMYEELRVRALTGLGAGAPAPPPARPAAPASRPSGGPGSGAAHRRSGRRCRLGAGGGRRRPSRGCR